MAAGIVAQDALDLLRQPAQLLLGRRPGGLIIRVQPAVAVALPRGWLSRSEPQ